MEFTYVGTSDPKASTGQHPPVQFAIRIGCQRAQVLVKGWRGSCSAGACLLDPTRTSLIVSHNQSEEVVNRSMNKIFFFTVKASAAGAPRQRAPLSCLLNSPDHGIVTFV